MSYSFKPSDAIDMSNEKSWPSNLGMLDWDSTSIVFTKRTLLEFLKYTGTTVDPNFTVISKLPRYAKFGKISTVATAPDALSTSELTGDGAQASSDAGDQFKPSRRVRTVPGGPHSDIFGQKDEDDALAAAPPKPAETEESTTPAQPEPAGYDGGAPAKESAKEPAKEPAGYDGVAPAKGPENTQTPDFKPTRRVRAQPGGTSTIGSFFGSDDTVEEFKPTRRVRQGPGGQDNVGGLW